MYESGEMYLETILLLKKEDENIRSIDIARELNFSKASVSRAMGKLKEDGYILIDKSNFIDLTIKGEDKARDIYEKHMVLTKYFIEVLKVPEDISEEDACRIEHVISDETFQAIKSHLNVHLEGK